MRKGKQCREPSFTINVSDPYSYHKTFPLRLNQAVQSGDKNLEYKNSLQSLEIKLNLFSVLDYENSASL